MTGRPIPGVGRSFAQAVDRSNFAKKSAAATDREQAAREQFRKLHRMQEAAGAPMFCSSLCTSAPIGAVFTCIRANNAAVQVQM